MSRQFLSPLLPKKIKNKNSHLRNTVRLQMAVQASVAMARWSMLSRSADKMSCTPPSLPMSSAASSDEAMLPTSAQISCCRSTDEGCERMATSTGATTASLRTV